MKKLAMSRIFFFGFMLMLVLSVVIATASLYPESTDEKVTNVTDISFVLSPLEMRRDGLGSFRGGENISIAIRNPSNSLFNFSVETYNGTHYSTVSTTDIEHSFSANSEYYEVVFFSDSSTEIEIQLEVSIQKPKFFFPFSWLNTPAKILFFFSLGSIMLLLLKPALHHVSPPKMEERKKRFLSQKGRRVLLILIVLSLAFWFFLLVVNNNPFASFENWYTDHARHSYSSTLFTKVGFSIFDTPLGQLSSNDNSYYKFVTWPQMAHIYPLGSILLFLPFGFLLQNAVTQVFVFKMEIAVFLLFAHVSLYYFLERFWTQKMFPFLKLLGVYAMYIPLIVYAANGMYDAVPFLLALIALKMYLNERYDYLLLFMAISVILKYQAAIFLLPLIIMGVLKLFKHHRFSSIIRNKAVIVAGLIAAVAGFTAVASSPYLMETKPEFVMNGVNAFSSHAQITWETQSFAVLSTIAVTLLFAVYMRKRNPLISFSAVFILLPMFTMPFFQMWYLPFFFGYALIPQQKRDMEVTMLWLLFIMAVLSFGEISFNPLHILDGWQRVLGL
ncbi:MAG: hypothetical protein NWE84_02860 [Candidatus Bathyarchaeota archaeon]|nr:hypothetical protein [Candidatus Bathyarchaeota archaeon]